MFCKCGREISKLSKITFGGRCEDCFANGCENRLETWEEEEKGPSDILKSPVQGMNLSQKMITALINSNIHFARDLIRRTPLQIMLLLKISEDALDEIKAALNNLGLSLK